MRITACCCTYLRPHTLPEIIECFNRQPYENKHLVILDDAGQYLPQTGPNWELHSTTDRYPNLGAKRNAVAKLAGVTDVIAVCDDDDLYLPNWFECIERALRDAYWCRASHIWDKYKENYRLKQTNGMFHATYAYRLELFERVGGYTEINAGEDQDLVRKFEKLVKSANSTPDTVPYHVCRYQESNYHTSGLNTDAKYKGLAMKIKTDPVTCITPHWRADYLAALVNRPDAH